MKMTSKICCLILVALSTLNFVGCIRSKNVVNDSAEHVIKQYLTVYNTIYKDDVDLYRKIEKGITYKYIDEASVRFKPLMMDSSYERLVGTRESSERIKDASKNNYTTYVKSITLEKFNERTDKEGKVYDYTVVVVQTSLTDNKIKDVTVKGGIQAVKQEKKWKVTSLLKSGADMENEQVETVIKDYVNLYYIIDKDDISLYNKIIAGNKDMKILQRDTDDASGEFKGLMTTKAYKELQASRIAYGRIKDASEKNYCTSLKSIKLEKYSEDKASQSKVYYYDIALTQKSITDNKVKIINDKKQITLIKIKDSWKVEHAYVGEY